MAEEQGMEDHPREVDPPVAKPARRMPAILRYAITAIFGALLALFASYLLRKIGM